MSKLPVAALMFAVLGAAGLALAWLAHDAPLAPGFAHEWLRADALSALALILLAAHGLAGCLLGNHAGLREAAAAALFGLATGVGHLAVTACLLTLGGAALSVGRRGHREPLLATLAAAGGFVAIGATAGEWRYGAPGAGAGLSSVSFALLLLGALLAIGGADLVRGHATERSPLAAVVCLYALLRLFSLGPWNLGWLFAALTVGGAVALWAAWQGAAASPGQVAAWVGLYLGALAIAGAGLGSGAGVTLAGYALLTWPVARLGLDAIGAQHDPEAAALPAGRSRAALWLLSGAVPLTAPFIVAWMAVAAAMAGGLTILAAGLWAAALLAALPVARLASGAEPASSPAGRVTPAHTAAALSLALGLGAPLVLAGLLGPMAEQLQGGLTPFGEIALWPWAGLIALNAARQPVATLPSLALAALMLILSALCWVALRLSALRRRGEREPGDRG